MNMSAIDFLGNALTDKVDRIIENRIDTVTDKVVSSISDRLIIAYTGLIDITTSVIAIGLIGYIFYQIIRYMFLVDEKELNNLLFGYFMFLLIRIFNTISLYKLR